MADILAINGIDTYLRAQGYGSYVNSHTDTDQVLQGYIQVNSWGEN